MKLLQIPNLKELHIFKDNLNFPIAIYIVNDWENAQLSYLDIAKHNSESLCKWCINHHIQYQILYPIQKMSIIKNPYKYFKFMQMQARLRNY